MRTRYLIVYLILTYLLSIFSSVTSYSRIINDFRVTPDSVEKIPEYEPKIAFSKNGNFIVVWCNWGIGHNNRQIYFQRFNSTGKRIGIPVLVSSDTNIHYNVSPCIAIAPSGSFVISWGTTIPVGDYIYDIWIQGFDSSGYPAWLPQIVDIDRTRPGMMDLHPDIAMDKAGNFVIVWETQDLTGRNVYAQRFDSSGKRIGKNVLVSDLNSSDYKLCEWFTQNPSVAFNPEGYFFICWHGCIQCQPSGPNAPLARIYRPNGEPMTNIFPLLNPCSSKWKFGSFPFVASTSDNNFIVVFNFNDTLGNYPNNGLMVQTFDTLGNSSDSGRIVNDIMDLGDVWHKPIIIADNTNGYIVLWADRRSIKDYNLWAQQYNSSGKTQGHNYRINIPPGSLSNLSAQDQQDNWFMYDLDVQGKTMGIAWVDYRNYSSSNADIYAKLIDLDKIGVYLRGDVVIDGSVDTLDLAYQVNCLFKNGWGILPEWTGDVNSDSKINITDVIYLVNYLFKRGPAPKR